MTVKITIIGLGRIGASIGLALASHKDQVTLTGHDRSPDVARKAQKLGAVDKISYNLPASVDGADVILLAVPFDQVRDTLQAIARDIREDAVIMDTAPVKSAVAAWVQELLPAGRHYVGLTPALNPACLQESASGVEAARADLFQKGLVAVNSPRGTVEEALTLAANFVTLLGAQPFYVDTAEVDGITACIQLLPDLAAAALAETVLAQPGWSDIRKLAGAPFARTALLLAGETPSALAAAALANRQNTVRVLDALLSRLQELREAIAREDGKVLTRRLEKTRDGVEGWQQERARGDWSAAEMRRAELPKPGDFFRQQIGGLDRFFRRGKRSDKD